jgi:hypothetical protein
MRIPVFVSFFSVLFFSCSNHKTSISSQFCVIKFDSLSRTIDTSQIEIERFSDQDSMEVRDKSVKKGEGSVFHFDRFGNLGIYAFMVDWPHSNFMIVYDSTGKKRRLQEDEVIQWRYDPLRSDSILRLTIFLCTVDRNYGELELTAGSYCDSTITLYNSAFTKVVCFKSEIPLNHFSNNRMIYIKGRKAEKCTGEVSFFIDSADMKNL